MKFYLGNTKPEDMSFDEYDEDLLSKEYRILIKEGKLGLIDFSDFENEEINIDDLYLYKFDLIYNEDPNFVLNESQKHVLVIESDFECDAAMSLVKGLDFNDASWGYVDIPAGFDFEGINLTEEIEEILTEKQKREEPIFICANNTNELALIYEFK